MRGTSRKRYAARSGLPRVVIERFRTIRYPILIEPSHHKDKLSLIVSEVTDMTTPNNSNDLLLRDLDGQQVWRASVGLDLADRTVLEAEVLMWRIVRQKVTNRTQQS